MPILHNMVMSGNCYKVRLLAHQLGILLTLREYGLHDGETRQAPFLAKNPNGRVPMLELDDGRTLPESNAILFYLSEGTQYQPADKWARAQMMAWLFFEQYSHEPYVAVLRYLVKFATPEIRAARRTSEPELRQRGDAALGVMQTHLTKHEWFAGDAYSIADIALYGYTHCAGDGGFDLDAYPAVSAWLKRVAARPGYIPL